MIGLLLLGNGCFTVLVIDATRSMSVGPNGTWPTAEFVSIARTTLPSQYFIASQGLGFGVFAIISAVGLFKGRPWASRIALPASGLLVLTAVVAMFITPWDWDVQAVYVLMCLLMWWEAWKWRRKSK